MTRLERTQDTRQRTRLNKTTQDTTRGDTTKQDKTKHDKNCLLHKGNMAFTDILHWKRFKNQIFSKLIFGGPRKRQSTDFRSYIRSRHQILGGERQGQGLDLCWRKEATASILPSLGFPLGKYGSGFVRLRSEATKNQMSALYIYTSLHVLDRFLTYWRHQRPDNVKRTMAIISCRSELQATQMMTTFSIKLVRHFFFNCNQIETKRCSWATSPAGRLNSIFQAGKTNPSQIPQARPVFFFYPLPLFSSVSMATLAFYTFLLLLRCNV